MTTTAHASPQSIFARVRAGGYPRSMFPDILSFTRQAVLRSISFQGARQHRESVHSAQVCAFLEKKEGVAEPPPQKPVYPATPNDPCTATVPEHTAFRD